MGRVEGKRMLVTGAANGIGAAIARAAIAEGAFVMLTDIDEDGVVALAASLGAKAAATCLDVRHKDAWDDAVQLTVSRFGGLDVLINNAGFGGGHLEALETIDAETMRKIVNINFLGTVFGHQAVIAPMRASGRGAIVNVSSTTGRVTMNGVAIYAATKAAINSLTKTAALELGPDIRVNAVLPGSVHTDMGNVMNLDYESFSSALTGMPLRRAATAEEMIAPVLFFASDDSRHCTGAELLIDAGQAAGLYFNMLPGHPDAAFHKLTKAGPEKFKDKT